MDHEEYCARLSAEITRMASVAEGAAPTSPVPGCPGWDLAKLVKHTGIIHRWAAAVVATRATGPIARDALDVGLPADQAQYPQWLAAGATPLVTVLRAAGPAAPVWSWASEAGAGSGWWARRMLHETTVHRADAETALGVEPSIEARAAADGIDEFLSTAPRASRPGRRLGDLPAGQSIHLHATDDGLGEAGEWLISVGDGGYSWSHGHAKGSLAVRGPAAALLLLAYGRVTADDERLALFGDQALIARWQEVMTL
ncbi:MAG TPA: maleylpyruvate isomerase family mycothiol-dependent enzyme [Trebonia sp.]|nr:maleylpyruvate isomerase family mycothiol-dependent enzyme [Trebonia sp.]